MPILSVPAHFDGDQIRLDEEVKLSKDSRLIVTVIEEPDKEREEFLQFASANLAKAYEDDEVDYSESDCIDE